MRANKKFLKETILQACEDIKANVNAIITNIDKLDYLNIIIEIDNNQSPRIRIDSDYSKDVTITDKIQEAAMNG